MKWQCRLYVDDDDDTDDEYIDNDYHIENEEACFVYGT